MPSRTRPLSQRKSLGTPYNLRPRTERVEARSLRVGDVVLESPDHPVRIERVSPGRAPISIYALYIWQTPHERPWLVGRFHPEHPFDRAESGEY